MKWIMVSLLVTRLVASEVEEEGVTYAQSLALMEELLKVERSIDSENRDWKLKQQGLSDLLELYQQELQLIDEEIDAAGSSLKMVDDELERVKESIKKYQSDREAVDRQIGRYRLRLLKLMEMFPEPLRQQLIEEEENLSNATLDLQEKVATVVRVLKAADKFNRVVSYSEEMHMVDGVSRQLRVLYVGLAGAYYVSGDTAGTGKPSKDGWVWTTNTELQAPIARAVAVFQKTARPQLVDLPVEVQSK